MHLSSMATLLLFLLSTFLLAPPIISLNPETKALLSAKGFLSDPTGSLSNWNPQDSSPCNWTGVICSANASITSLSLSSQHLSGSFPPTLCRLINLSVLILSNNLLNSTVPSVFLLPCRSLTHLDLSGNQFTGPLPSLLHLLPSLTYVNLGRNNFSGMVPVSYALISRLDSLSLLSNQITGPFPSFLFNISSLRQLIMSNNPFNKSHIPHSFSNLTSLEVLMLSKCNLVGQISGSLSHLFSLTMLDLSHNHLTGSIPAGISKLSFLQTIDASRNMLSGTIPADLFLAPRLVKVSFHQNHLSGSIPPTINNCRYLKNLRLFSNYLSANLPTDFGKKVPLVILDLSDNFLSGAIPDGICDSGKMKELLLSNNNFVGAIPNQLGQCRSLRSVRLSNNSLSGEVPSSFWGLPKLQLLDFKFNNLSGVISSEISSAKNLTHILISHNSLAGSIPDEIGDVLNLYQFTAAHNRLSGKLPKSIVLLSMLGKLDLHDNLISGEIPSAIQNLKKLVHLNLARNQLSGMIPGEIGRLYVLSILDLSCNYLTGEVPVVLEDLKLSRLNLSYNLLTGALPPYFSRSVYRDSFLGNPGLCGLSRKCEIFKTRDLIGKNVPWISSYLLVLIAVILITAVVYIYVRYKCHKKEIKIIEVKDSMWKSVPFQKLAFSTEEIVNSLKEENVIGTGASSKVYKAVKNGEAVAVKQMLVKPDKVDRLRDKVAILANIRHRNIVKLICYCTRGKIKLLVCEYVSNGSLTNALHGCIDCMLDWPTRYKIVLDVANGLSYLHHDCNPPIWHGDIKSSKILLAADFTAKITFGDTESIGFEKPNCVHGSKTQNQNGHNVCGIRFSWVNSADLRNQDSTKIMASCGYIAPEYGGTLRLNEKCDVYSFGVLALELISGRFPIGLKLGEESNLVKWIWGMNARNEVDQVIDPSLDLKYRESIHQVIKVGIYCTRSHPVNRPSMRTVVRMLLDKAPS